MKFCLTSDCHGNKKQLMKIANLENNCDFYIHLGDSELLQNEIKPFVSVKGNNDYREDYPEEMSLDIKNHHILLIHGTGLVSIYNFDRLVLKAKQEGYDTVIFGHTHIFKDEYIDEIRLINPGSCYFNKDRSNPCYAIMNIDDNGCISVERCNIDIN